MRCLNRKIAPLVLVTIFFFSIGYSTPSNVIEKANLRVVPSLGTPKMTVNNPNKHLDGHLWDYTGNELVISDPTGDAEKWADIEKVYAAKSQTHIYFAFEGIFNATGGDAAMGMLIDVDQTSGSGYTEGGDSWGRKHNISDPLYAAEYNFYVWDWQTDNFGFARWDGSAWGNHDDWDPYVQTAHTNTSWEMAIPFSAFSDFELDVWSTIAFTVFIAGDSAFEIAPDDASVTPNDYATESTDYDVISTFVTVDLDSLGEPVVVDGDLADWDPGDLIIDDPDADTAPTGAGFAEIKEVYAKATMKGIYFGVNGDFNSSKGDAAFGALIDVDQTTGSGYTEGGDSWGRKHNISDPMYAADYNFYCWDYQTDNFGFARWDGSAWGNHDDWDPYVQTAHTNTSWEMMIPYSAFEDFKLDVWSKIAVAFFVAGGDSSVDVAPDDPAGVNPNDDAEWTDWDTFGNFAVVDLETTALATALTADGDDSDWPNNYDTLTDANDGANDFADFHNISVTAAADGVGILLKGDIDSGAFDGGWHLGIDVDQFPNSGVNVSWTWVGGLNIGTGVDRHFADFMINMWDLDVTNRKWYAWNATADAYDEYGDLALWDLQKSADEDIIEIVIPFDLMGLDGRYPTQIALYAAAGSGAGKGGYNDTIPVPVHGNLTDPFMDWFEVIIPSVLELRNQYPVINEVTQTPTKDITADDLINVQVNASDADGTIASVKLRYYVQHVNLSIDSSVVDMNLITGTAALGIWNATIGPFEGGDFLGYYIEVIDDRDGVTESDPVIIFILPSGFYVPARTIDGDISDWPGSAPAEGLNWTTAEGVFIYRDWSNDDTGADLDGNTLGDYIYNDSDDKVAGDGSADILELRIFEDQANFYFLVIIDNLTTASRVVLHLSSDISSSTHEWSVGGNELRLPLWTSGNGIAISLAHEDQTFVDKNEVNTLFWAGGGAATTEGIPVKMITDLGWEVAVPKATLLKWGVDFRSFYLMGSAFRCDAPQEFSAHEITKDDVSVGKSYAAEWADPDVYDLLWLDEAGQVAVLDGTTTWMTGSSDDNAVRFMSGSPAWRTINLTAIAGPDIIGPEVFDFDIAPASPDDTDSITVVAIIGDPSGIETAYLEWTIEGATGGSTEMTPIGAGNYEATVGPFAWLDNVTFMVYAKDTLGNTGDYMTASPIIIGSSDITAPIFSLTGPTFSPTAPEVGDNIVVSIEVTDDGVGVEFVTVYYSIDGTTYLPLSMTQGTGAVWSATLPSTEVSSAAGTVYVYFYAEDKVENGRYEGSTTDPYTVVVKAAPETTETTTTSTTTTSSEEPGPAPGFTLIPAVFVLGLTVILVRRRRR
ncbi:MAG: Heimdall-CTERM domain-containing surface protein [Promethearchaeota archaeon]